MRNYRLGVFVVNIILTIAATTGVIACGLYAAMLAFRFTLSLRYAHIASQTAATLAAEREQDAVHTPSQIGVVQPILSGDPFLEETLRSNLQSTTKAHFYWMIDDHDHVAAATCQQLARDFPGRTTIVICPPSNPDQNPKSLKLQMAREQMDCEVFAVLDDDTMIDDHALHACVDALRQNDLVTGLPCYEPANTIWGSLLAHFVNNNSISTYLPMLNFSKPVSINGMFYMARFQLIQELRPFEKIVHKVCDDYELATLFRERGLAVAQLTMHQRIKTHVTDAADYRRIMHRWFVFANRLFQDQPLGIQLWLAVVLSLPPILLWLVPLAIAAGWPGCLLLATTLLFRHLHLRQLHLTVFGFRPYFSWCQSLAAELLQPIHILGAIWSPRIVWRGKPMRLDREGGIRVE